MLIAFVANITYLFTNFMTDTASCSVTRLMAYALSFDMVIFLGKSNALSFLGKKYFNVYLLT